MRHNLITSLVFATVVLAIGPTIQAAIIVTTSKSGTAPTVSSVDLAQTEYLSSSGTGSNDAAKHAHLFNNLIGNTDGDALDAGEVRMDSGNTFTVNFDISTNTLGYDITGIDSYFGWNPSSGGRSNQGYEIILTFVDNTTATLAGPTHWEPNLAPEGYWTTVSFAEFGGGTLFGNTVNLNGGGAAAGTSVLASGVKAITFDIANNANAGSFPHFFSSGAK